MADAKLTDLSAIAAIADEDLAYLVDDPSGAKSSVKATFTQVWDWIKSRLPYGGFFYTYDGDNYDSTSMSNGDWRANNPGLSSATAIYFKKNMADVFDVSTQAQHLRKGDYVYVCSTANNTSLVQYVLTSDAVLGAD